VTLRPDPPSPAALAYAASHSASDDPVLVEVEEAADALGELSQMQVGPAEGALLTFLAQLVGARDALEVGTFLGYGSICLARGLAPGGRLLTLELDPERAAAAHANLERAGLADRVEVRVGPAAEALAALPEGPRFDLAWIDADKGGYPEYYELVLARLRPGGLLVMDNVLLGGRVLDPDGDATARAMDALNARIARDERVTSVMLPLADGMTLVRRRTDLPLRRAARAPVGEPAIVVEGLTKRYGAQAAVDDLSFAVRRGAVTGFLGPNGAGKTTTLRMLLGLARPTAGRALILGKPYGELEDPVRTVGASLEVSGFHPGRSGRDHLRALARMAGLPASRVQEVLDLVELGGAADRRAGKYSMGMRQRLALAATLLGDPQVLVLDEPANGLDPQGIRWLRDFLRGRAQEGRTVLVSSHVLAEVAQTVDDVVVITRGRRAYDGPIEELTARGGSLEDVFLELTAGTGEEVAR